jgi:hypothetical protein
MGNILFRLPALEASPTDLLLKELGPRQVGKVERRDGAPLEPSVPEYLVEPVEYGAEIYQQLGDVELIDFGECTYTPRFPFPTRPNADCQFRSFFRH